MITKSDEEAREEKWAREDRERQERERYCPFVDLQQCSERCRFFARYSETYCKLKDAAMAIVQIANSFDYIVDYLEMKMKKEASQ